MKLIRWLGGKSWLKNELQELFKTIEHDEYFEPFAGGLGSFLAYQELYPHKKVYLNDLNKHIIQFYQDIKLNPQKLAQEAFKIEEQYNNEKDYRNFYLKIRQEHNKNPKSATLWFLLHHSFNGIYRENKKGEFNVPYNSKVNYWSENIWQDLVLEYSERFKNVEFSSFTFDKFIKNHQSKSNSLFYFDPPYYNHGGDNDYLAGGFNLQTQYQLLAILPKLPNFIYSNHAHPLILEKITEFQQKIVSRRNIVTSKKENRGDLKEEILAWKRTVLQV